MGHRVQYGGVPYLPGELPIQPQRLLHPFALTTSIQNIRFVVGSLVCLRVGLVHAGLMLASDRSGTGVPTIVARSDASLPRLRLSILISTHCRPTRDELGCASSLGALCHLL